jgi:hypothetical protein
VNALKGTWPPAVFTTALVAADPPALELLCAEAVWLELVGATLACDVRM